MTSAAPANRETGKAYSWKTPRSLGLTLAIASAAFSFAVATASAALSRAPAILSAALSRAPAIASAALPRAVAIASVALSRAAATASPARSARLRMSSTMGCRVAMVGAQAWQWLGWEAAAQFAAAVLLWCRPATAIQDSLEVSFGVDA